MVLLPEEQKAFFRHYLPLLYYAGVCEGVLPETALLPQFYDLPLLKKVKCRDALFGDPEIIRGFLNDNGHLLSEDAKEFTANVQRGLYGKFVVLKQYAKFSAVQHAASGTFYHVVNIAESVSFMLGYLPQFVNTAIFNFNGKIICDGLIEGGVRIGSNTRVYMLAHYKRQTEKGKVVALL